MHRYGDETSRKIFGQKDICGQIVRKGTIKERCG